MKEQLNQQKTLITKFEAWLHQRDSKFDVDDQESSMTAEDEGMGKFIKDTLPSLQSKYDAIDEKEEEKIINDIKAHIENKIAECKADGAKDVDQYNIDTSIGAYSTALRALNAESNLASHWKTNYFALGTQPKLIFGSSQEIPYTYRRVIAYMWLATTDENMEPAELGKNLSADECIKNGQINFILN